MAKQHYLNLNKFISKIRNSKFQVNQKKKLQQILGKTVFRAKFSGQNSEKAHSCFLPWKFHRKNQVNVSLTNLYLRSLIS